MSEPKPIYNTLDDNELAKIREATLNNEPLSTKQLHELITSQAMTIDRLLGEVNRYKQAFVDLGECLQKGNYIKAGGIIREMVK